MLDDLCFSKNSDSLVRKSGGSALVYKAYKPFAPGNIRVVVASSRFEVGPIESCRNVHSVRVELDGASGAGEISKEYEAGALTLSGSTMSVGCAYPEENPPVTLTIVASQQDTGKIFVTSVAIPNVATGQYTVVVSVDADNVLTGVRAYAA